VSDPEQGTKIRYPDSTERCAKDETEPRKVSLLAVENGELSRRRPRSPKACVAGRYSNRLRRSSRRQSLLLIALDGGPRHLRLGSARRPDRGCTSEGRERLQHIASPRGRGRNSVQLWSAIFHGCGRAGAHRAGTALSPRAYSRCRRSCIRFRLRARHCDESA